MSLNLPVGKRACQPAASSSSISICWAAEPSLLPTEAEPHISCQPPCLFLAGDPLGALLPIPHPDWCPGSWPHTNTPRLLLVASAGALLGHCYLPWTLDVGTSSLHSSHRRPRSSRISQNRDSHTEPGLALCGPRWGQVLLEGYKLIYGGSRCGLGGHVT